MGLILSFCNVSVFDFEFLQCFGVIFARAVMLDKSSEQQLVSGMGAVQVRAMAFDAIATLPLPKFCFYFLFFCQKNRAGRTLFVLRSDSDGEAGFSNCITQNPCADDK